MCPAEGLPPLTCLPMQATKARVRVRPTLSPRLLKLMRRNSGAENLISVGWLVGSLQAGVQDWSAGQGGLVGGLCASRRARKSC